MTDFTYLDIETIPCQDPAYLDKLRSEVKAPGNLTKQESIDAWLAENRDAAAIDALAKTSFDPARGHICAIAWAHDDDPISARRCISVADEAGLLSSFFGFINPYHSTTFVGHYINGFDIRFLLCRAVVLGVQIPYQLPRDPKPWDAKLADTMTMWAGAKGTISMDKLAEVLGIEGKHDFDGSMVAAAWAAGEYDKIAEYCADDVRIVRGIHRRFLAVGW